MLKLTVIDPVNAKTDTMYGSEQELNRYLRDRYLAPGVASGLHETVGRINDEGLLQVAYEPWEPSTAENVLPDGYQTASQATEPDPWPRAADQQPA